METGGKGFGGEVFAAEGIKGLVEQGADIGDGEAGGGGDIAIAEPAVEFEADQLLLADGQGGDQADQL